MRLNFLVIYRLFIILLLTIYLTIPAYGQLEFTQLQFEQPRTESSNPSSAVEYNDKVYLLIRNGIVVWDLNTETWEKKEVIVQTGFNSSYIGVVNDKIITFPDNLYDMENGVYGREPAILDPATFELRGIKDINPNGIAVDRFLTNHAGKIFFLANDGTNGKEVWVTDGTNEGTVMLHDMTTGAGGESNIWAVPFLDKVMINYNRKQFWVSDGTPEGTELLKDFGESVPSLPISADQFTVIADKSYFVINTPAQGQVIWETNGTPDGTIQFTDFTDYEITSGIKLIAFNGALIAFGTESQVPNYPFRILKIDLTTSSKEDMAFVDGLGSITGTPKVIDNYIYYAIFGHHQSSGIYRFDGTVDGIEKLKGIPDLGWVIGAPLTTENGFFWAIKTASSGQELWYSDKTEEGTLQVKDIDPGVYGGFNFYKGVFQNTLFFSANDGATGTEPWVSQGTPETTYIINDFETSAAAMQATNIKVANDNLYFNLNVGGLKPNLFKLNGTKLVDIINQPNFQAETYFDIELYQDKIFFGSNPDFQTLYPADNLYHLFSYDGTEVASTKPISGITSGPREFSVANDILFFIAGAPSYGNEYWISDGTANGTKMLKDINPGSASSYAPWLGFSEQSGVVYLNGTYYFSAIGPGQGHELWKTDLTEDGTTLIKDINTGAGDSYPYNFTTIGSHVYFTATSDGANYSSWVTDGTELGTIKLVDQLGSAFYQIGDQKYIVTRQYISESNKNLFKIWKTDGTLAGTSEWRVLGEFQSIDAPVAQIHAGLFFVEGSDSSWSYNLLKQTNEIIPILSEYPATLSTVFTQDQNVYFVTNPEALWVSDGSVEGTFEIETGQTTSLHSVRHLTRFEDDLVFNSGNFSLWSLNLFEASFETKLDGQVATQNEVINLESAIGNGKSFTLEIQNKGYANIDLTGTPRISISGPASSDFSVIANPGETIGINKSTSLSVEFNPKTIGLKQATLSIEINDGRDYVTFSLSGTATKINPTITFSELLAKNILDEPFDLTASVNTDQEISYSSSDAEVASIEGKTVTIHKAGTTNITASVGATEVYNAASTQQSLTINGVEQTITFGELPTKTFGDTPFELSATASSNLAVTFSSSDPTVASIEGNKVTILKVGSTTITASQAGNDNYSSASATQTLTINKAGQTIMFSALPAKTFGDAPFELSASSTSGLGVSFSSTDATIANVEGTTVTILKPGSVTITASQTGNDNYLAAEPVTQQLVINKASQSITFEALPSKTFGDAPFELSATSSTGLPVTFSSTNPSVVSVENSLGTIAGAGSATISASQAGDDNYQPATAEQTITVNKAAQSITFDELPTLKTDDEPIELTATSTSGLPVSFGSQDETIALIEGSTLTVVSAGETSISALQAGNANYLPAEEVVRTLVVEAVTGLRNDLAGQIRVYPNPTEDFITVSLSAAFPEVEYILTTISGLELKKGVLNHQHDGNSVRLDNIGPGVYLLTLSLGDKSSTFRVIKN